MARQTGYLADFSDFKVKLVRYFFLKRLYILHIHPIESINKDYRFLKRAPSQNTGY